MSWRLFIVTAMAAALMLPAAADAAATADHKPGGATTDRKKKSKAKSRGVGFLPGYRTPEQLRRIEHRPRYWDYYRGGGLYYFGGPRWYGGRWNGGSFGPCWANSPIGLQWSCGQ
jgi:hypothetical protein